MGKQTLGSALKGAYPWVVMGGIALLIKLSEVFAEIDFADVGTFLVLVFGVIVLLLLVTYIVREVIALVGRKAFTVKDRNVAVLPAATRAELHDESFRYQPWLYDRHVLIVRGQVAKVKACSWRKDVKFSIRTFLYRCGLRATKPREKQIIRLLLSSAQLKDNEKLLVIHDVHNIPYLPQLGDQVEVKGEYIHQQSFWQGLYGSGLTFYGHLRLCEEPRGYLKKLDELSEVLELSDVVDCGRQLSAPAPENKKTIARAPTGSYVRDLKLDDGDEVEGLVADNESATEQPKTEAASQEDKK